MSTDNISGFPLEPLPPHVDCESVAILRQLNKASRALGQLKGEISKIPNSQILLDTLTLQEAKDSNEIENIVTTDDEVYRANVDEVVTAVTAKEALNYAKAIKHGLDKIQNREVFTTNDIMDIQKIISPNHPIRKIPGTALKNPRTQETVYIPPQQYNRIIDLLQNLEEYINNPEYHDIDSLIKMPIIHYQFESIHPFFDGNGRTGRLINILYLVHQELLDIPVLYLSKYIIENKGEYYRLLQEVRDSNAWEEWIIWMLRGVEVTSKETIVVVNNIRDLMNQYKITIRNDFSFYSHELINILFKHPYTKINFLERELNIHRNTAASYLNALTDRGLLSKVKIGKTNYYINNPLLQVLKNR